jgi:RimJ/RimL family protein N-acetyltransferase
MAGFNANLVLSSNNIILYPLKSNHFEELYQVASDPLIWEQHPNKDRYKREVFTNFFEGAIKSKGAYLIRDKKTEEAIGSSRYYDENFEDASIFIGYTFMARKYWGSGYNTELKNVMLTHAFDYFDKVYFHVGINNIRSQIAMERIGGVKQRELMIEYYNEPMRHNVEYLITRSDFLNRKNM